jgi:AbiV family abortive infection protein
MPLKIEPILDACLANAERLIESAKAVRSVPGCNHIAFNLVVLALEEIGKSILLFQESLKVKHLRQNGEEAKRPLEWIDDHERKLFWAIWFGDASLDWRTIGKSMEAASNLHFQRLAVLYFDPTQPNAQAEIDDAFLESCFQLAEARLGMEKAKKYRELSEQDRNDIQWFFYATNDPQLKMVVFSKASLEKQKELDGGKEWIRWLRESVEESQRSANEIVQREMARKQPEEGDDEKDKWRLRIKLKSWSHSIRKNQLLQWNEGIAKIKLYKGAEHNDLTVEFTVPKSITIHGLWNAGMQNNVLFVTSLNIASFGFFWWYLPKFTSRYHESITDLETNMEVILDRVPELKIVWPQQALKQDVLGQNLGLIFSFVVHDLDKHMAVYHRYFGVLGLMAKNDLFFQFEHHLVHDFMECLKMAMQSYGDWDGDPKTFEDAHKALVPEKEGRDEFVAMVFDLDRIAGEVDRHNLTQPVTLEHAIRAKLAFDTYIHIKARAYFAAEYERDGASRRECDE